MDPEELHWLVLFLKQEIDAGRFRINPGLTIWQSLERIEIGDNGKVDPATVDGRVLALANTLLARYEEQALARVSLQDLQREYFELVKHVFGHPYREMVRLGRTPQQMAERAAEEENIVRNLSLEREEFFGPITEFWQRAYPLVYAHVGGLNGLVTVFGGSLFPFRNRNIATTLGLYVDTVVLPEPLIGIGAVADKLTPQALTFQTTQAALSVLQYEELALANVDPPIVVIVPEPAVFEQKFCNAAIREARADLLLHAGAAFNDTFRLKRDLDALTKTLKTPESFERRLRDHHRLLIDVEWTEPPGEQITRHIREIETGLGAFITDKRAGQVVSQMWSLRFRQLDQLLSYSSRIGGIPVAEDPTFWEYMRCKFEHDADAAANIAAVGDDFYISRSLIGPNDGLFRLLTGLPNDAIIRLRREGALADLRHVLRQGVETLEHDITPGHVQQVETQVANNLQDAFRRHEDELIRLAERGAGFFGFDVPAFLGTFALAFAGFCSPTPILGYVGALGLLGPGRKVWTELQEMHAQQAALRKSSIGILFSNAPGAHLAIEQD